MHARVADMRGKRALASISVAGLTAIWLEGLASAILVGVKATEPPFACFSEVYDRWSDQTTGPLLAAAAAIVIGLVISIGGLVYRKLPASFAHMGPVALVWAFFNGMIWLGTALSLGAHGLGCL